MNQILEILINIVKSAGNEILKIYTKDFEVEFKDDHSPLTEADKASHKVIVAGLKANWPDIPIISEEADHPDYSERSKWTRFWLVDPLDGTKEFVRRNGEFTVNIALMEKNQPILGVIHVPVTGETYAGGAGSDTFLINAKGERNPIKVSDLGPNEPLTVVQSRSHSGEEENIFYGGYTIRDRLSRGSSLKICMIAEGKAELYFRSGPTMEWDTAAGHAILLGAGGYFTQKNSETFQYNKKELLNPGFIAAAFEID